MATWEHLKPGDTVTRMLAGTVPMPMRVKSVDGRVIHMEGGWDFDAVTGVEIDRELGWGPEFGITGSYLVATPSHLPPPSSRGGE